MSQFYFMRSVAPTRLLTGTGRAGNPLLIAYDEPGDADRAHVQTFLAVWDAFTSSTTSDFTILASTPRRASRVGGILLSDRI